MINKRRREERVRSAMGPRTTPLERVSMGEEAKQTLRNLSLINNQSEAANQEWTKQQDNLSLASFSRQPPRSQTPNLEKRSRFKKAKLNTRNSSPVIADMSFSRQRQSERKQFVPLSVEVHNPPADQRIHAGISRHNFVGGKQLNLLNEAVFRKTAATFGRSFRPASLPHHKNQNSLTNYLQLNCKNICKQISPLRVRDLMLEGEKKEEQLKGKSRQTGVGSDKANIIRKLLKEQRKNNFNESIFRKELMKPDF